MNMPSVTKCRLCVVLAIVVDGDFEVDVRDGEPNCVIYLLDRSAQGNRRQTSLDKHTCSATSATQTRSLLLPFSS
jgi:hypothetical protein